MTNLNISSKMPFRWQINASSISKLIGDFWLKNESKKGARKHQMEALAKTWLLNVKRMPKFGVRPSTTLQQELAKRHKTKTTEQIVQQSVTPQMKTYIKQAVARQVDQRRVVNDIETTAKQKAESDLQEAAAAQAKAKQDSQLAQRKKLELADSIPMKRFHKISSGLVVRIHAYFYVDRNGQTKVYQKISAKTAVLSSLEQARKDGWTLPSKRKEMRSNVERAEKRARISKQQALSKTAAATETRQIAQNIRKVVTCQIQTTRGQLREDTDLKAVQRKMPTVRKGNQKAYFENFKGSPYGAFVIGYIDGFDTQTKTVIELKNRAGGLFREVRLYEKVQCFMYMKMCRCRKAKLVETFGDERLEYDIDWDQDFWNHIKNGIHLAIQELNRIEKDAVYRQSFIELVI